MLRCAKVISMAWHDRTAGMTAAPPSPTPKLVKSIPHTSSGDLEDHLRFHAKSVFLHFPTVAATLWCWQKPFTQCQVPRTRNAVDPATSASSSRCCLFLLLSWPRAAPLPDCRRRRSADPREDLLFPEFFRPLPSTGGRLQTVGIGSTLGGN